MTRLEALKIRTQRYPHEGPYKKLSQEEKAIIEDFIIANDHLDKGEFEFKVNRMFLDKEKPKNFTIILDLLTTVNIAAKGFERKYRA